MLNSEDEEGTITLSSAVTIHTPKDLSSST